MTIPPKTTVFVGNISEEVNPELMEKILQVCFAFFSQVIEVYRNVVKFRSGKGYKEQMENFKPLDFVFLITQMPLDELYGF